VHRDRACECAKAATQHAGSLVVASQEAASSAIHGSERSTRASHG
jgi:hypothetical protein